MLAGILLALFGVVVGVLVVIQKRDSAQIGNVADYELPMSRISTSSTSTPTATNSSSCARNLVPGPRRLAFVVKSGRVFTYQP